MTDRLVWIDCEMTGLDLRHDALIEIACLVTDAGLNLLDDGIDEIIKPPPEALDQMAEVVRALRPGLHYETDDDGRNATLTDDCARAAEQALGGIDLYAADQIDALTRLNVALHAHALLRRDVDYIVRDGEVRLISASRGRVAELQRWPDGLQAAVEAKDLGSHMTEVEQARAERRKRLLLNGPAPEGEGIAQTDIDRLLG